MNGKSPHLYPLCHLIPLTQCSKQIVRPLSPRKEAKTQACQTPIKSSPWGLSTLATAHLARALESPLALDGGGAGALGVCPGLVKKEVLPACVSRPGHPIPAHSLQGHAGLWAKGQGKGGILPSLGSGFGEQTKESHRRDFLAVQWLKF